MKQTSDLFDEVSFWNLKTVSGLLLFWHAHGFILSFSTLRSANWSQVLLAITQVTQGVGVLELSGSFTVGYVY